MVVRVGSGEGRCKCDEVCWRTDLLLYNLAGRDDGVVGFNLCGDVGEGILGGGRGWKSGDVKC